MLQTDFIHFSAKQKLYISTSGIISYMSLHGKILSRIYLLPNDLSFSLHLTPPDESNYQRFKVPTWKP